MGAFTEPAVHRGYAPGRLRGTQEQNGGRVTIDPLARRLLAVAVVATIAACSNVRLRGPGSTVQDQDAGRSFGTRTAVVKTGALRNAEVRRVCRGSRPSGWIAIEYVADSIACGGSAAQRPRYPVALIVSHRDALVGESLEVCAAEGIPSGWVKDREIRDDPRCPYDRPSSEPTVMVIRRVR